LEHRIYTHESFPGDLAESLETLAGDEPKYIGVANVGVKTAGKAVLQFVDTVKNAFFHSITWDSPLPIRLQYSTPETLGMDRVVGVIGAAALTGGRPTLSIDAGTAVTYDFLSQEGAFLGGGISPGMRMRFRALDEFTAALPLVSAEGALQLVGDSTEMAIRSGVVNGLASEIDGVVDRYRAQFGPDVQAVLTGGDAEFLGNQLKNINFVDPQILLVGINRVLNYKFKLNA
jgi:type III pantothenate kinase